MKTYEEYKSTGILELDKIPTHWDLKRLYGIGTSFYKGSGITKLDINNIRGTQCLRYADIFTKFQISFFQTSCYTDVNIIATPVWAKYGDILFAGTGEKVEEIGKNIVYLGTEPMLVGGDIIGMRHQQNAKYLSYLLSAHPIQIQKSKGKSKLKVVHITANELKNIYLPLPPTLEQEAIAAFLDSKILKINTYVAERERELCALEELKQAEIASVVTRGMTPDVPMHDSGIPWIGQIPAHWEVETIRSLFRLASEKNTNPDATLLSLSQYDGISLKRDAGKTGMFEAESTIGYNVVHKGQFVMNIMLAWNGSYAVSEYDGVISPAYCVFDFIRPCNKKYFDLLLRQPSYAAAFKTQSKGLIDSRLRLYPQYFKSFPIIIPPIEEQNQIVEYINNKTEKIDRLVSNLTAEIDRLKEFKQKLISDTVTGQIDVRDYKPQPLHNECTSCI